ncbi:hypothetical protein [Spirosoma pollinicola]|uniref:Outer membrane protein beta-barrel domain-containing protein n=1 Tax=Spirosoma pollinicola TaxID=2057025 RepID=A0A2K8Z3W4_9BACT|nr:hypothetical protein [Spirosoma pollinicola]AUD04541.1 hypothetical protein CWM47_23465 [Spirosoma pollinicola]
MKFFSFILILGLLMGPQLYAQDAPSTREIGLRASDLNSFGLIYKKQISENTYRRYRLAFGNLGVNFIRSNTLVGFSAGGAMGKEKRRPISDKMQFIYGTELIASVNLNYTSAGSITVDNGNGGTTSYTGSDLLIVTPSVGIGFVLGAQYNFNPKWYISAELIPSITGSGSFGAGSALYSFQAGFNSSSAGITGAYRF